MGIYWNYFKCCIFSWIIIKATLETTLDHDFDTRNAKGLFPGEFNLAATSNITANATCGETKTGAEIYCKLVEHVFREDEKRGRTKTAKEPHCGLCDSTSSSPDKRHPISNAIDGTNRWWQSPTLQNGKQYEWVTIALDLGEVYQITYIIIKAAVSPRPGNWILERSIDGIIYKPWQYYALTDSECWETYGIRPTVGKPRYRTDDEVICTSFYSKLNPLEDGEIHTSLVDGRPGGNGPSMKLREFTKARYVRLRLQKIRTLNADLMTLQSDDPERIDKAVTRRYFYSIKDISIGGQCVCSGHAANCLSDSSTGKQRCVCEHNTCGENCQRCCQLFNQKPWRPGTRFDGAACEKCECNGHADRCHYDQKIADERRSINTAGRYEGGGVCDGCKHHTTGINCEQCEDGYYRPVNVLRNHSQPCKKCRCSKPGMTGICVKDDSHRMEGLQPGDCLCKPGFTGKECDQCAIGYRNYPRCDPCPCHSAGTVGGTTCEGDCVCKVHVEGSRCEKCKPGYYHLSADNPDGCSQCFCFGATDDCTEGDWGVELIEKMEDWRVTDIRGRHVVRPTPENGNLVIANDEVSQFKSYYWLAPPDYLGKKLYSYGADLKFTVSYVVARGDTSGTHTESADVILEGNGEQFGYKWGARPEVDSFSITMPLREHGWFHLNPSGDNVGSVSREAFTLALNNVTRILIRAKFHTDQVEGRLHNVGMEIASKESKSLKKLESVEKCVCPPGYDGLSCEKCASGYREIGKNTGFGIICQRCDCYNHAESCDADTGRCRNCLHNTTGLKCDRCVRGYYGDATIGTPDDCKPCACPLENPENNFSPSCTAVKSADGGSDYSCDLCPEGFVGDKCERCAEGYFGNPQIPGGYCQPCDCSGNADTSQPGWCDRLTGQCLKCLGNTAGWNCGECLAGHYGNPERQNCQPCSCNHHGSISPQCDHSTGQCVCKPNFVGRTCNRCADGFGNVETGCEPCKCNKVGSRTESCDPVTGICFCKPGVFGVTCDSCLEGHYGFSRQGCLECNCSPSGAVSPQCDEDNGHCSCKPHVTGRACDRCEDGFWNINSGRGCEECQCNRTGSVASLCDKHTGQCSCKTGVGGKYCDQCLPGYYKFSGQGCRKCDPCDIPGHICDPNNGRCVCPPYTTGRRCQKCVQNAWGHNPLTGCTPCNCNTQGTPSQACDPNTGKCVCLEGFEGRHCDQCRHGFYNFPVCSKCDCSGAGTDSSRCQLKDGICQCNERGDCICKENVMGQKCSQCIEGAFSLTVENPKGCHQCFCFGRTQKCNQASMAWSRVPLPSYDIFMEVGTSEIPTVLGFQVIPNDLPGRRLGIPYVLDKPLYWNLPKEALGDKVLSYNGFLNFNVEGHSQSHFPGALLKQYPAVVLQGNHRLILVHHPPSEKLRGSYRVQLYENEWKLYDNPKIPVRKEVLMVALQNVQAILIRATDGPDVKYARMHNVSLDTAATSSQPSYVAEGIEMCRCPRQYVGTSCQDPARGFYRKRKPNYLDSKDVLDLVGWAEPCSCNNHTNICDRETGVCIDCSGNTMGPNCDQCMKGFYGDPTRGPCRPCACPRPTNSFSGTCVPDAVDYVCIDCQTGYTGRHCERCASGFYGDPIREGGRCVPCECNTYGSQGRDCDQYTGQCRCQEGISGRDCTICSHGFILTEYGCKSCEDECTGILLNELYQMQLQLDKTNFTAIPRLPWGYLNRLYKEEQELRPLVSEYQRIAALGNNLTFEFDLAARADMLYVKAKENIVKSTEISSDAKKTLDEAQKFFEEIGKIFHQIRDLVSELQKLCTTDPSKPGISAETLLRRAEEMLREIKRRNFGADKADANSELSKARNLLDKIKMFTVDHGHLDDLKQRVDVLNNLLDDIIKKINNDVLKPVERGSGIIQTNRLRNNELKRVVDGISGILDNCNATLKEAADLLSKARSDIIDAAVKFQSLPGHLRDLENATDKLDVHRSILGRLNAQYKDEFVIPAQRHADELEKQSQYLNNQFSATRKLSEFPLEAAKAYQNIIDAINDAEVAAGEADRAAVNAYRQAYPETDDALVDQAAKAKERSIQLLMEAEMLSENKVPQLEEDLNARKYDLDKLGEDIAVGRRSNDIINRKLDAMPKGIRDSLVEVEGKLRVASGKAGAANNVVDHINEEIENDLKPKLEKLLAGTVDSLDLARMIQKARDDVKNASMLAERADASARRVAHENSIVALNLKKLKDKIFLARQKASSIHVAVTVDKEEKCVRSFKPLIEPSTTNNIVLNYAIKSDKSNSMLFFLGSPTEEDFMAIEMVNRKIRFLWNAGGGTKFIEHDRRIETNNEQLLKNSQWFKIEVNRIGNLATLSVKRTPEGQKPDPSEVTGASPVGFTKMDLDSTSKFFIGGFPENFVKPSEMRTSSLAGCLYEVTLDGKPVGLWNFVSNDGCDGCKEGATEEIDISAYEFQGGKSYAIMSRIPYYRKSDLYIALSFKTLNEDGLLFFAGNPNVGDFISLELKEGKVLYQLKFGGRNHLTLKTSKKYNTGNWIRVEAAREKYQAQMLVEAEMLEESGSKQGSAVLDLQHMPIYFGGVPPNFTKAHWPGITFVSYFGCMKNLQIDTTPFALSRGSVYGMTSGCSNRPMKVATFKGSGFLELNSQPILSDSSFTFSFYTNQKDALLLVSTFSGQDNDPEKLQNYYSVSVKDGKIEARFNSGTGEISMVSDQMLTSGVFHTVDVIRKNRKLVLRVDDVEEAEIRLSRGAKDISAPQAGGLFIGGVKDGVSIDSMVASPQKLIGIITDVVFNGRLMRFENTVGHRGVDFGQPDVSSVSTDFLQQMALSHPSESCYSSYALLEKDTVSFGGASGDFLQHNFDKKELSKNFNISLEFRTFYENGTLFTLKNDQKRQQLAVYLRENYIIVDFRKKKAEHKNILSNSEMSQGDWHMVALVKSGKILSLYLNKKKIASTHIPKRLAFKSPLYIGGVPADAKPQIGMATTSYLGCIRNLMINGSPRKVPKTDRLCFSDVERGLYFTGKGYGTYDLPIRNDKEFVISILFRTTQLNGNLLTFHDALNKLWFKLELLDGEVLVTVYDEKNTQMFKLSNSFDSKYDVCDNKWHTAMTAYKGSTLTLHLDRLKSVHKEVEKSTSPFEFTSLYIGGTPGNYHNLFSSESNFVGCLQSLTVNGQDIKFERVKTSSNTVHNSCPQL